MIRIYIVDRTAEGRTSLTSEIERFTKSNTPDIQLLPPIEITPVDINELKHRNKPDLVILGPELAQSDITLLSEVTNELSSVPTMLVLPDTLRSLPFIERIARIGITDFITASTTATDFLEKLICLSRSERRADLGTLILVDSAKGGTGTTTLVAALGEALATQNVKTTLIDLDIESQSLARFLRVTPYINESLGLLLSGRQAITRDFVSQTVSKVWANEECLYCMTPPPYMDSLVTRGAPAARPFISIIEEVLSLFEVAIVDVATARGGLLQTLYRCADKVVVLMNGEPATAFTTLSNAKSLLAHTRSSAKVFLVNSETVRPSLSIRSLQKEMSSVLERDSVRMARAIIPFSKAASSWPASGGTAFSVGNAKFRNGINTLLSELRDGTPQVENQGMNQSKDSWLSAFKAKILTVCGSRYKGARAMNQGVSGALSSVPLYLEHAEVPQDREVQPPSLSNKRTSLLSAPVLDSSKAQSEHQDTHLQFNN